MKEEEFNSKTLQSIGDKNKATEMHVPVDYFEKLADTIILKAANEEMEVDFFAKQQEQILFKIGHAAMHDKPEFSTPNGYFEEIETRILKAKDQQPVTGIFRIKNVMLGFAAAACVAVAIFFILPNEPENMLSSSFDDLMAQTYMSENELFELLSNEEVNNLYQNLIENTDYMVPTDSLLSSIVNEELIEDKINDAAIKPIDHQSTLTFEDITEDELIDYLLEEDADVLNNF